MARTPKREKRTGPLDGWLMSRRNFLAASGAAVAAVTLLDPLGRAASLWFVSYEPSKIGSLSSLRVGEPVPFRYPWDHPNAESYLIKLGTPAGGGVGPDADIVAFNVLCTHMGTLLLGTYKPQHQVMGPCPAHFSTFDLTRFGMVVSGHATQGLPQVRLEVRGDDIYAVGMMGLMYGFSDNQEKPL